MDETAERERLLEVLSKREKEVFPLICEGLANREIAKRLFISSRTVETHKARILRKLGKKNAMKMLAWAINEGVYKVAA
jgi:two-component system response regulator NreC